MKEISYMDWIIRYSNEINLVLKTSKENLTNSANYDIICNNDENNVKE